MDQFLFTNQAGNRRILFSYENGILMEFTMEGNIGENEVTFLSNNLPWFREQLKQFESATMGKITRVAEDLSFQAFWDKYAYKVGNKTRTEKLWDKLSDTEKALVLKSIPIYDQFLAMRTNQDKAYPETFLSQRRFENNYKIL